jgi:site-specific DNA-methyltransferase (adenine-specific)
LVPSTSDKTTSRELSVARRATTELSPTGKPKFKPMPDLPPEEFEALKQDIAVNRLHSPIDQDELGNTLDGHQRERALQELGIKKYPINVISGLTEQQKWEYAVTVNVLRRHLSSKAKRELIQQELRRTPKRNNNWLAEMLGVDSKTVKRVREDMEATREIPKLTHFEGRDEKVRPTTYRVVANTPNELVQARDKVQHLPSSCDGKVLDVVTAKRHARQNKLRQTLQAQSKSVRPMQDKDIQLHHCRFQDLIEMVGLQPATAKVVLTDFPYNKAFLPELRDLAAFAERMLMPGGLLVTYSGHYYLDKVFDTFGSCLKYRWTMASVWKGGANPVHPYNIMSKWKPILLFSKGDWKAHGRIFDVVAGRKEKALHKWQQPLGEVEQLVSYFSKPGDLIVDPCGGAFTTAEACWKMGRRFVGCDIDVEEVNKGLTRLAESRKDASKKRES